MTFSSGGVNVWQEKHLLDPSMLMDRASLLPQASHETCVRRNGIVYITKSSIWSRILFANERCPFSNTSFIAAVMVFVSSNADLKLLIVIEISFVESGHSVKVP